MWMNEYEIDEVLERTRRHLPEIWPYAKFLSDWRDVVNGNSDGWPYWKAGSQCAEKLMDMLKEADAALRRGNGTASPEAFAKTLTPIKSFATRKNLPCPVLQPAPAAAPGGMRM
jgi:hypothetical protein